MIRSFDIFIFRKPDGSNVGVPLGGESKKIPVSHVIEGQQCIAEYEDFKNDLITSVDSKIQDSDKKLLIREINRIFKELEIKDELEAKSLDKKDIMEAISSKILATSKLNGFESEVLKKLVDCKLSGEDFDYESLERKARLED
jgi:hypothetical protein